MQTNGYAFTRNVLAEFEVILKNGESLTLTPLAAAPVEKKEEKKVEKKEEESKDQEWMARYDWQMS